MSESDNQPDLNELHAQAEDAKQILASPVFNAAFVQTNNQIIAEFMQTPPEAAKLRESLHGKFGYGQQFVQNIKAVINAFESRAVMQEQKEQQQEAKKGSNK